MPHQNERVHDAAETKPSLCLRLAAEATNAFRPADELRSP